MLKRTKYSRLRNDSPTSVEDRPQRMPPHKREVHSDVSHLDAGQPSCHGPSAQEDMSPHEANIRLKSSVFLPNRDAGADTDGHTDGCFAGTGWRSGGRRQRTWGQTAGKNLPHVALSATKRPLTLHRLISPPWTPLGTDGPCGLKMPSAADDRANTLVHYDIKYMGSVEVTHSMRNLDFDARMQVTREAISRICERTSSARTAVKMKGGAAAVLGQVDLEFSRCRILLTVSTDSVTLFSVTSLQKIAHHPIHSISFASGGDTDLVDYVAYVAKDFNHHRACHVLECPRGRACEVINSMGQAFQTRFRQILRQSPSLISTRRSLSSEETQTGSQDKQEAELSQHCHYYNMTPGRTPPPGGMPEVQNTSEETTAAETQDVCFPSTDPVSLCENCSATEETSAPPTVPLHSVGSELFCGELSPLCGSLVQDLFQDKGWFHGRLGRKQAESLLSCSGDFLVRESSSAPGQYVLSGMDGATVRHLLLIDPHGQVRTCDHVFLGIGHLVRFHMETQTPIISGGNELRLQQPILQPHSN